MSGTRTVTISNITDFHGHIERGVDNAYAFELADSHNSGNVIPVSTGDFVGGSPYDSAVLKDQPALDMAKAWGLTISAVGNHEFDRGVDDFNDRIADPNNGIDWLCANVSDKNKASDGRLSHVKDYVIRTVNGKRVGFIGALTDQLASVATPQITQDVELTKHGVDAINAVARSLKATGQVDAVVALFHSDASHAVGVGDDVDLIYAGHSHAVKRLVSKGGAPIIEAGSFGNAMAVQDLVITGSGRQAKVTVKDVDLGNGTQPTQCDGVLKVSGITAHPKQAAWLSAGERDNDGIAVSERIYERAASYASRVGSVAVGSLKQGEHYDKGTSSDGKGSLGVLVADANREMALHRRYTDPRLPVVGFSNDGSLRTDTLDADGDRIVTAREVGSLMALQFDFAYETVTGAQLKTILGQQFRRDNDGRMQRSLLSVSSNVAYRYVDCAAANGDCSDMNLKTQVAITGLRVDNKPISDNERLIVASNTYLLQGGGGCTGFKKGTNYTDLGIGYAQPLQDYFKNR